MGMSTSGRVIVPDEIEAQSSPYLSVWPSLILQGSVLFVLCFGLYIAIGILDLRPQGPLRVALDLLMIALPLALWLLFCWWRERRAPLPRARLVIVVVITLLAANAVSLPLSQAVFQPERWLPLEGATQRILGYAFTGGVTQALTLYLVVYFCAYPGLLRVRTDSLAYFASAAVAYSVIENIQFLLRSEADPQVMAVSVFFHWAVSLAMALLLSLGVSEVRFSRPAPFLLTLLFALSAFVYGAAITFRAGLVNARFSLSGGSASPLLALFLAAALVVVVGVIVAFFYGTSARRSEESARAQRPT